MRFVVETGIKGLERIRGSWKAITAKMKRRRFYHLYEWYSAYLHSLEERPDLVHFIVGCRGDDPTVVVPVKSLQRGECGIPLRVLALPRHPHLPLSDVIFAESPDNADVLGDLVRYLASQRLLGWDLLSLGRVLGCSRVLFCVRRRRPARTVLLQVGKSNYVPYKPYDRHLQGFSKNFRGNLRKARNKLARLASVEYECARGLPQILEALDDLLRVEASGWKGKNGKGSAILCEEHRHQFYRQLVNGLAPLGRCEVNLLKAGGECLAGQFCIPIDGTYHVLKIGYDESAGKVAPGNMLLEWLLETRASAAAEEVDLVTDQPWHRSWRPFSRDVYDVLVFNRSLRGLLALAARRSRTWVRSLLGSAPQSTET